MAVRQLKPIEERDPYAAAVLDAFDRVVTVPAPVRGLTIRKGVREANVHEVKDGTVFYGIYLDGNDWPAGIYRATLEEWDKLATQAVSHGAEVFSLVRAPHIAIENPCAPSPRS
jgi:hypothetical protein